MTRFAVLACALFGLAAAPAAANDSVAELRPGGLLFVTNDDVVMEREDLTISMDEVRVDYVFRNTAENPVSVTVAFPMPVIEGNPWSVPAIPEMNKPNFLDFGVEVDGVLVKPKLQQRAEIAGIDVTDALKNARLPLEPFAETTITAIESLTEEALRDFVRRGILVVDTYDDDGAGMKDHYMPYWALRTTYYWDMVFKPDVETRISHRYRPSVGGTVGLTFRENGAFAGERFDAYVRRYCIDDAFVEAIEKRIADTGDETAFHENRLAYVLTTGRNWSGAIRTFNLTVDKGSEDNLVSFCASGVTKTSPTTFSVSYTEFNPERDLDILILSPPQ